MTQGIQSNTGFNVLPKKRADGRGEEVNHLIIKVSSFFKEGRIGTKSILVWICIKGQMQNYYFFEKYRTEIIRS